MTEPSNKDPEGPILAKKGTAQPLTPPADSEREQAPREDPGLGSKPRQNPPAAEATPEETKAEKAAGDTPPAKPSAESSTRPAAKAETPPGPAPAAAKHSNGGAAEPEQSEAPDPTGEDEDAARAGPGSAKETAPAATLLDHPMRLPKSVVFEDRPKSPSPPAQSTPAADSGDTPAAIAGDGRHDPSEAPESDDAGVTPGETEAEAQRRRADLASWVQEGRGREKSVRKHWPVAVGALVCAIALIALVESGVIPLGDQERESPQPAEQTQGAPSPESGTAGAAMGETGRAMPSEATVLAVLPDPEVVAGLERDPVVDFIRLDPEGKAVVAGRAAPGTEVVILDNGAQLGRATADIYGLWTFVSDAPLAPGRHDIVLALESEGALTILPGPVPPVATSEPQLPAELAEEAGIEVAAGPTVTLPPADESAAATPAEPAPEAAPEVAEIPAPEVAIPEAAETPAPAIPEATKVAAEVAAAAEEPTPSAPVEAMTVAEAQTPSAPVEAATAMQSPAETPEEATTVAAAPVIEVPPQPVPKPERATAPQVAAVAPASGSFAVQLASLTTPNAAQRAQGDLEKRFPDLLAGLEMFIDRATLDDGRVVYRVRTGLFGSRADAKAACARFKAREQDCLAVRR
jgi:cell division septation protein DedD